MKVSLTQEAPATATVDVLAVGVSGKKPLQSPLIKELDKALGGALRRAIQDEEFKAGAGQTLALTSSGGLKAHRLLVVGLGKEALSPATVRRLGHEAARAASQRAKLGVVAPDADPAMLRALTEGLHSGAYRYTRYLTGERKPKRQLQSVSVLVDGKPSAKARRGVREGSVTGEAIALARDLVNAPPNDMGPEELADAASKASKSAGIVCKVHNKRQIERMGMHLLLAVSRGTSREPRFVHMTYTPKNKKAKTPKVVFVGKGLTFDSGGLCVKPPDGMVDMKLDMAGAAVTIATVIAAAKLELPVEVHGIVGATENMTGADAYRPGDVFPSLDGKTVEIINTDAEGRLVLADALTYARKLEPDFMVDHATLTGACMVALGPYTAGLFCEDERWLDRYRAAAEASGESYWHMPLTQSLREMLKSDIADLKHTGARMGGAITAGLFLKEFVGKTKWAHVDIAGPAYLSSPHGIYPKGGTGFGVLTAVELLRSL